ncbi:MAG TPA: hypothetical protein ENK33_12805 [Desulfobacterales bacterium]|nr:hypothetical protein [Desulfobacterales bacterium]
MHLRSITIVAVFLCLTALGSARAGMNMDMKMGGKQIMLPMTEVSGVRAMAHIKDIKAAMAKMGMTATHHFMVMFTDLKSGEQLTDGMAAVKITNPAGKTSRPVMLMAMRGIFGSDITMNKPGIYKLSVGTRLNDGQKRVFHFSYTVR